MFVTFGDINDPNSVMLVDPANLGARFGDGYEIKSVTAELTDVPVTVGIVKKLRWLANVEGALMRIETKDYPPSGVPLPLAANLTEADFHQGTQE
jgi:hypothetical protein